jgi:hypothetical protein
MRYQLDVATPPRGQDPVIFFLFNSQAGYCEYFASAMGEMLRSLDIPVRLVNGFGPGQATEQEKGATTIRASDAHTWVEVYFSAYGWVPFEPTPDPLYPTITRGAAQTPTTTVPSTTPVKVPPAEVAGGAARGAGFHVTDLLPLAPLPVIAIMLLFGLRFLRGPRQARDIEPAWRRLHWLAWRLRVARTGSETPLEFAGTMADALPPLRPQLMALGRGYSRALYSREGLREQDIEPVNSAWQELRHALVRTLLFGRRTVKGAVP